MRQLDRLPIPFAAFVIEQTRATCVGDIGADRAGQAVAQEVFRQQELSPAREHLRLRVREPAQLRGGVGWAEALSHLDCAKRQLLAAHRLALRGAALIHPEHRRYKRLPVGVEQDRRVHQAG